MLIRDLMIGQEYALARTTSNYDQNHCTRARLLAKTSSYTDRYGHLKTGTGFELELLEDQSLGYRGKIAKGTRVKVTAKQIVSDWASFDADIKAQIAAVEYKREADAAARQRGVDAAARLKQMGYVDRQGAGVQAGYRHNGMAHVVINVDVLEMMIDALPQAPTAEEQMQDVFEDLIKVKADEKATPVTDFFGSDL